MKEEVLLFVQSYLFIEKVGTMLYIEKHVTY